MTSSCKVFQHHFLVESNTKDVLFKLRVTRGVLQDFSVFCEISCEPLTLSPVTMNAAKDVTEVSFKEASLEIQTETSWTSFFDDYSFQLYCFSRSLLLRPENFVTRSFGPTHFPKGGRGD